MNRWPSVYKSKLPPSFADDLVVEVALCPPLALTIKF